MADSGQHVKRADIAVLREIETWDDSLCGHVLREALYLAETCTVDFTPQRPPTIDRIEDRAERLMRSVAALISAHRQGHVDDQGR